MSSEDKATASWLPRRLDRIGEGQNWAGEEISSHFGGEALFRGEKPGEGEGTAWHGGAAEFAEIPGRE